MPWTARPSSSTASRCGLPEAVDLEEPTAQRERRVEPRPRQPVGVEQGNERLLELVARDPAGSSEAEQRPQRHRAAAPRMALQQVRHREPVGQPPHFRLVQRPLQLPRRRPSAAARSNIVRGGEVTGIPSTRRDLVRRQRGAVARRSRAGRERRRPGHFEAIASARQRFPRARPPTRWLSTASGPQASTAAIHRAVAGQQPVPDGVDAAMNRVQLTRVDPTSNRLLGQRRADAAAAAPPPRAAAREPAAAIRLDPATPTASAGHRARRDAFRPSHGLQMLARGHAAKAAAAAAHLWRTLRANSVNRSTQKRPQPAVAASGFDPFK